MATLSEIRTALANTVKAYVDKPIHVYDTVEEIVNVPCIMVEPYKADFEGAFQRGMHCWDLYVYVIAPRSPGSGIGQVLLDQMVSGGGPNSVVEIIAEHPDLGLHGVDAQCIGLKGYGGNFEWAKIPHVGAILTVRVLVDPR